MSGRGLRRWTLTLAPGEVHDYRADEWADALVVVQRGELEVECRSGRRERFPAGAVLTLVGLPLRRLHNRRDVPVVLVAVSRSFPHR